MERTTYMDDIVEGLQEHDSDALREAMNVYGDKLLRLATTYVKDENMAVDIVQQVFIKLYYKIEQFDNRSSLYTWLYRITINQCKSKLRTWSFRNIFFTDKLPEQKTESNVENIVVDNETSDELYQGILRLDPKYRLVIVLYYYHDFQIDEIANILETNENTIKTRLFRARKKLKKTLNSKGGYYE